MEESPNSLELRAGSAWFGFALFLFAGFLGLIQMSYFIDVPVIIPVLAAFYLMVVYVVLMVLQRKQA